jgi:hypothetical protein
MLTAQHCKLKAQHAKGHSRADLYCLAFVYCGSSMTAPLPPQKSFLRSALLAWFAVVTLVLLLLGLMVHRSIDRLTTNNMQVIRNHEVVEAASNTLSQLKDIETGQRGYVISGQKKYLERTNQV